MSDTPPGFPRRSGFLPDDPPATVDETVEEIVDPDTPEVTLKAALTVASGAQLKEAHRRLRLLHGSVQARLDLVELCEPDQALRELERRHPGIGDDAA